MRVKYAQNGESDSNCDLFEDITRRTISHAALTERRKNYDRRVVVWCADRYIRHTVFELCVKEKSRKRHKEQNQHFSLSISRL